MSTRIEPTRVQLQAAFACERRESWPSDLDAAMQDPLYARIVRLHAVLVVMGRDPGLARRINQRPEVIAPEPPHPAETPARRAEPAARRAVSRPRPTTSPQLPLIDRKRAAGGDNGD